MRQPHITVVEKLQERGVIKYKVGDRVPFIIIAGKESFTERAEDPDYVKENNLPIDTDYYINKQILPPVLRILEVFVDEGTIYAMKKWKFTEKNERTQLSLEDF